MGDIQQWRRKIQPAPKVKTPAAIEPDDSDEHSFGPNTPKQRLKRKVSSYFDFAGHTAKAPSVQDEFQSFELPQWPSEQPYPEPKAEEEIDSLICTLMAEPHRPLDPRFNCSLMRIFESFAKLKEECRVLQTNLEQEHAATRTAMSQYNMALKDWQDEKRDYKEEVKRLEVLLAKSSKRGLAEVTLARQDSKIRQRRAQRDDDKETILEFLEKTKRYDDNYNSQRATMRPNIRSPSHKDKRVSRTLAKKSMTNIYAELPFGTPPGQEQIFSLTQVSMLEEQSQKQGRARAITVSSASDSTFSSFSYEDHAVANDASPTSPRSAGPVVIGVDDSSDADKQMDTLPVHHQIRAAHVRPQLLYSGLPSELNSKSGSSSGVRADVKPLMKASMSSRVLSEGVVKRQTVMSKASGFFHRLIPQSSTEGLSNPRSNVRRFSFEPGDDQATLTAADESGGKDRLLRKSASLAALSQAKVTTLTIEPLSPVAASPTASLTPTEGRPPTRIPTPVYKSFSLAKPRQEREDSASSLLTAIRHADDVGNRSSSLSSSVFSSSPASRVETNRAPLLNSSNEQGSASALRSISSSLLTDHVDMLRGGSFVSAAANRSAGMSSEANSDGCSCRQLSNRGDNSIAGPDTSEFRQENKRPVI